MSKTRLFLPLLLLTITTVSLNGQEPVIKGEGIEVVLPSKQTRDGRSYLFVNAGLQNPFWVNVPMVPENTPAENIRETGGFASLADGYSFGIGVMHKTKPYLEAGLLADYYYSSVPLASTGQRSTGPWVFEQTGDSYFTETFDKNHLRVSEVFAIRATIRLKIPIGPVSLWGGITGGTYSSNIRYSAREESSFLNSTTKTLIAPSWQTGIDCLIRNNKKRDLLSITFFADFTSPTIEENIFDAVITGWQFSNPDGNHIISPVRFGLAIGIH